MQEATKSRVTDGGEPPETLASSGGGELGAHWEDTVIHLSNMRLLCFPLFFEVNQYREGNEEESWKPRRRRSWPGTGCMPPRSQSGSLIGSWNLRDCVQPMCFGGLDTVCPMHLQPTRGDSTE